MHVVSAIGLNYVYLIGEVHKVFQNKSSKTPFLLVVFRSDEKIGYGIVWELQNDDRSLDPHDRLLLTPIKIFIH